MPSPDWRVDLFAGCRLKSFGVSLRINFQMKPRPRRRSKLLIRATGHALAGLIRAVKFTSNTVYEPRSFFDELRSNVPFIQAMWHGQFMMLADLNTREFEVAAMVSRHGDAEVIAHVLKHFGISAMRGAGAGERRANRGGAYAMRAALRALDAGSIIAMTADVPPTKPRCAGPGIVALARLSGRPIIPIAAATSRFSSSVRGAG